MRPNRMTSKPKPTDVCAVCGDTYAEHVELGSADLFEPQETPAPANSLPEDSDLREQFPMADGLLDYFPNALAEVSKVSKIGNEKHNPGQAMHWSRGKSTDHRNKIMRHLIDAGGKDSYGVRHSAYLAWRALANLQEELERDEGYPMSRASKAGPEDGPTRQ